jgi:hypothetical protein
MTRQDIAIKGKRLSYYDLDRQKIRTKIFNPVEIEHANHVFDTIEEILLENGLNIRNDGQEKWISQCECGCKTHNDTYFNVEVEHDIIDVDVLYDIEDALEELNVKFVYVLSRHNRCRDYLQLVVIQKYIHPITDNKNENATKILVFISFHS